MKPAELSVSRPKPSPWRNLSFVWAVPVLALVVSLALAWKSFADRGELIQITFQNASGIVPGETSLRFRDVAVGTVEEVSFTDDLQRVIVHTRVKNNVAPYLDEDAEFWVVRPQVSTRGISGLSTVLSGVYIEGTWNQTIGTTQARFTGKEQPPLVRPGREGTRITLLTKDGRLISEGAPVMFRGIEVGRLERPRIVEPSDAIMVDAFIDAPHDKRLTAATRFWDTSGFSISFGSGGLTLDFDSLTSILAGGIEFDSMAEGGEPVSAGHVYTLYPDQAAARKSVFSRSLLESVQIAAQFDESISGLEPGAPVRIGGLLVGEVSAVSARVEETDTGPRVRLMADLAIDPVQLGLPGGAGEAEVLDFFTQSVEDGMRARLATQSLLSSRLVIDLVTLPDAEPATFDRNAKPLPILPSTPSDLPDFTATAEGMIERINALPIEELIEQATSTLASVDRLASADSTRETPEALKGLLDDARALVNDEATRALPGEVRDAIAELRGVITDLRERDAAQNLAAALESANRIAAQLDTASAEFPALVEDLRAVAQKANSLQAEDLMAAATRVLDSADAMIGTDAARDLPPSLNAALAEVRGTLADLRAGGAVENANATMAAARDAADAASRAAEGLPELSARLDALVRQAEGLIAAYGQRSDFNSETVAALREVRNAARAVSQLARSIERNPNSLIMGR